MIISDFGFYNFSTTTNGEVPSPVVVEFTKVGTNIVTSQTIDDFFISRNDGIFECSIQRQADQSGTYDFRVLNNDQEYGQGRIKFQSIKTHITYDAGKPQRGEY